MMGVEGVEEARESRGGGANAEETGHGVTGGLKRAEGPRTSFRSVSIGSRLERCRKKTGTLRAGPGLGKTAQARTQ